MPDMQRGHPSTRLIIVRLCLFDTVVTHTPGPRHELALGHSWVEQSVCEAWMCVKFRL